MIKFISYFSARITRLACKECGTRIRSGSSILFSSWYNVYTLILLFSWKLEIFFPFSFDIAETESADCFFPHPANNGTELARKREAKTSEKPVPLHPSLYHKERK